MGGPPDMQPPVSSRELILVQLALGTVALHAIDDAFAHPERGTSAGDHLASGLGPLVILLLAALAYPRVRDGARAVIASSLGLLALVGAIAVSGRHVVIAGLGGDDVTGLLAGLGGAVLMGCAVAAGRRAWRARRRTGTWWRIAVRRLAWGVLLLVAFAYVLVPVAVSIVATHNARDRVNPVSLGARPEPVEFGTSDGLRLRGWFVAPRNGAAVVVFPGRRSRPAERARMLVRNGYGVLVFDRRGEGESEGTFNAFGWGGDRDLVGAVRFLRSRGVAPERIGGLGLSVGGELMLEAAAEGAGLAAVVSEGAGTRSLRDHVDIDGRGLLSLISPLVAQTAATAIMSDTGPPPALGDLMPRIAPNAVFLIWAGRSGAGEDINPDYFARAKEPKQIWAIPESGHIAGLATRPREYERRVVGFFDRYLLGR